MNEIGLIFAAMVVGLAIQVVWWRVKDASLTSVLVIFSLAVASALAVGSIGLDMPTVDIVRVALFCVSMVLSYTIICSALMASSPSLGLMTYLATFPNGSGCSQADLMKYFAAEEGISDRVARMADDGLVCVVDGVCTLTGKGVFYARLFEFAARLFGLPRGG
jgi:hypothetical protein